MRYNTFIDELMWSPWSKIDLLSMSKKKKTAKPAVNSLPIYRAPSWPWASYGGKVDYIRHAYKLGWGIS